MAPLGPIGSLAGLVRGQVGAAVRLPSTALRAAEELRDAARAMRRVAERVDDVLDDVEEPVRALAPALRRLAAVLDDPLLADAPETLAKVRDEVLPALRSLRETQQRVAAIAGSTDRISALIDETGGRLAGLPGAAALLMRRAPRAAEPLPPGQSGQSGQSPPPVPPVQPVRPPAVDGPADDV